MPATVLYYSMLQYCPENLEYLRSKMQVIEKASPLDDDDASLMAVDACFAPLGFNFDSAKMDLCTNLKAIVSNTTGVPHIDVDAAQSRQISVFSLKDEQAFLATITPTAEHAWGLLLALTRNTVSAHRGVLAGNWNRRDYPGERMLSRMKLGIVGMGRLGSQVAKYGHAFGMNVAYFDPYVRPAGPATRRFDRIGELIAWSNIVTLHVPANEETRHLIDRPAFEAFTPGSYLINTSRGELVDEAALIDALSSGVLAGAATDVVDGEFDPGFQVNDHPLVDYARQNDNLLITPHIGGSTKDAWFETERRVIDMVVEKFRPAPDRNF